MNSGAADVPSLTTFVVPVPLPLHGVAATAVEENASAATIAQTHATPKARRRHETRLRVGSQSGRGALEAATLSRRTPLSMTIRMSDVGVRAIAIDGKRERL